MLNSAPSIWELFKYFRKLGFPKDKINDHVNRRFKTAQEIEDGQIERFMQLNNLCNELDSEIFKVTNKVERATRSLNLKEPVIKEKKLIDISVIPVSFDGVTN